LKVLIRGCNFNLCEGSHASTLANFAAQTVLSSENVRVVTVALIFPTCGTARNILGFRYDNRI
jgi:hypothetical protein